MAQTKKKAVRLPHKMSALIMLALGDLMKVERSKGYCVRMAVWHESNGVCSVCFAGSVMAKSLGANPRKDLTPGSFGRHNERALYALNSLRAGDVVDAAGELGKKARSVHHDLCRDIAPYHESPKLFRAAMRKLAKDLAARGL